MPPIACGTEIRSKLWEPRAECLYVLLGPPNTFGLVQFLHSACRTFGSRDHLGSEGHLVRPRQVCRSQASIPDNLPTKQSRALSDFRWQCVVLPRKDRCQFKIAGCAEGRRVSRQPQVKKEPKRASLVALAHISIRPQIRVAAPPNAERRSLIMP